MKNKVSFYWKKKPKPKLTDEICPKCKKKLMDFELVNGCFYCNQIEKIRLQNEKNEQS